MDKRKALKILIKHSFDIPEPYKVKLLGNMEKLSDEEVWSLGRLLALEKKKSLAENESLIKSLEDLLSKISH